MSKLAPASLSQILTLSKLHHSISLLSQLIQRVDAYSGVLEGIVQYLP